MFDSYKEYLLSYRNSLFSSTTDNEYGVTNEPLHFSNSFSFDLFCSDFDNFLLNLIIFAPEDAHLRGSSHAHCQVLHTKSAMSTSVKSCKFLPFLLLIVPIIFFQTNLKRANASSLQVQQKRNVLFRMGNERPKTVVGYYVM